MSRLSRRTRRIHAAAVLAVAVALVPVAGHAQAAPATVKAAAGASEVTDPALAYLSARYHLSSGEAGRRLRLQDRIPSLRSALDSAWGDNYGDIWIDQAGGGTVNVGATGAQVPYVTALAKRLGMPVTVVSTPHTIRQIQAAEARTSDLLQAAVGRSFGISALDMAAGTFEILVPRGLASASLLSAVRRASGGMARVSTTPVAVQQTTTACDIRPSTTYASLGTMFCDPPLRGGVGITNTRGNTDGSDDMYCSAGFVTKSKTSNDYYLLTAGHCFVSADAYKTRFANGDIHTVGPAWRRITPMADGDAMIIHIDNPSGWQVGPYVLVTDSTGNPPSTENQKYVIHQVGGTSVGLVVCATGRRDGTQCGTVSNRDAPFNGVNHLAVVQGGCMRGGDSGGPVWKLGVGYGLIEGGLFTNGDSNLCSIRWYYQGLNGAANALNVNVLTG
jgi:hypothetical protein